MSGRCVAVVSGKGGVGKTMLTAALAAGLALRGQRVAVVDLNTGLRGLDMAFGLENRVVFDLGDVLDGICELSQALVADKQTGVRMLAARQMTGSDALPEDALSHLCETLRAEYDWVLLDTPSGIGRPFEAAVSAADRALLLTTPDDAALRDTDRLAGLLQRLDVGSPSLVINRIRPDFVDAGLQYAPEVCAQTLDMRPLGVLPEDESVWRRTLEKRPVSGDTQAAWAIRNLLERIEDAGVPLRPWRVEMETPPPAQIRRGLLDRFRREAQAPPRKEVL